LKVGLTGGIGCGKSTVVRLFAAAGWRTLEVDAIVHELIQRDACVHQALCERWGDSILRDGVVDRKAIAARVFPDPEALKWLEELLHPLVRAVWVGAIEAAPEANWLVEIPLLFEKRLESQFDLTVCVTCPQDLVVTRMLNRGYTEAQVEQRRSRQLPLEEKAKQADRVITNAGGLEFLERQTLRLIEAVSE
jgi:dephospho-CoA kinase